jgi:hypothetical protein
MFGVENENDLLYLPDNKLVRCYGLLHCNTAIFASRYYEECNEFEKTEFVNVIRDCISKGTILYVGRIWKEGVWSEKKAAHLEELRREKHNYRYSLEDNQVIK